jgi:hypothetical protein
MKDLSPNPTAEEVFGPTPWIENPTYTDPNGQKSGSYSPTYFATPETGALVAKMLGGQLIEEDSITGGSTSGSGFQQDQPNEVVLMPDGTKVNAGIIAFIFTHGFPQSYINTLIANETGVPFSLPGGLL